MCVEIKALLFLRCSCTTWRLAIKRAGLTLSKILWRLEGHGRRDTRVKTAPEWSTVHCTRRREPGTSESSPRPIVELTTHCSALSLQLKPRALLLLLPPVCIVLSVINHWRGNSATSPWLSSPPALQADSISDLAPSDSIYLPSDPALHCSPAHRNAFIWGGWSIWIYNMSAALGLIWFANKQTMKKKFQKGDNVWTQ